MSDWTAAFAADLHLTASDEEGLARAGQLIDLCRARTRRLYLLGDVFDLWTSAAMLRLPEFQGLFQALRAAADDGLVVTFLPGNRDFNLTAEDGRAMGLEVAGEDLSVDLEGQRLWLTHGDRFLTGDVSYQRYKRVIRSGPLRFLARHLPAALALSMARRLRRYSDRAVPQKDRGHLAIDPRVVRSCLDQGVQRVLCGHVHRAERVDHGGGRELLVLPPFLESGAFLVLTGGAVRQADLEGTTVAFQPSGTAA